MMNVEMTTKQQELEAIRQKYPALYPFAAGVVILLVGFVLGAEWFKNGENYTDFFMNIYTEVFSIGITVVVLDRINEYRDEQRLKQRLVGESGSKSNETAKSAIDWIQRENWMKGEDSLLKGANLSGANLDKAELHDANLEGINLSGASLRHAGLISANLKGADLSGTDLEEAGLNNAILIDANLNDADLKHARLFETDLRGASLIDANLQHATLIGTNLEGANLIDADFTGTILRGTILPDGTKWSYKSDIFRFTNMEHPNFWNPYGEQTDEER